VTTIRRGFFYALICNQRATAGLNGIPPPVFLMAPAEEGLVVFLLQCLTPCSSSHLYTQYRQKDFNQKNEQENEPTMRKSIVKLKERTATATSTSTVSDKTTIEAIYDADEDLALRAEFAAAFDALARAILKNFEGNHEGSHEPKTSGLGG
jgi:hypothetical protein